MEDPFGEFTKKIILFCDGGVGSHVSFHCRLSGHCLIFKLPKKQKNALSTLTVS